MFHPERSTVAEIARELEAARARLAELERDHVGAALEVDQLRRALDEALEEMFRHED